jgi:transposase
MLGVPDTKLPSTTEEIEAIYASGPGAVVALVQQFVEQLNVALQANAELAQRITELEERLGRNSRNSNQPPSSDGFNRPARSSPRSLRQATGKTGKKSGGQPGHKGKTLRFCAHPDRVVEHQPAECAECGCPLDDVPSIPQMTQRRQVVDLPPLKLETTEHHSLLVCCPECALLNRGSFPTEAPDCVQYGPNIKALCVYLMSYQLLPYERTAGLLTDLFGSAPSEGTLHQAQQHAAGELVEVEDAIKESLRGAEMAHFDDTGVYIEGKRQWLRLQQPHVASTPGLTLYQAHPKRGERGTRAMGVLPGFKGVAVHDGYQSFRVYECRHALCNAHHLRELAAIEEQGQHWAAQLKGLLLEIKAAVDKSRETGQHALAQESLLEFEERYRKLVAKGLQANPPNPPPPEPHRGKVKQSKAYNLNLLVRLRDYEEDVLRFMHDLRVPFDNNQAERDLRMAKVRQKVSGCFRSQGGAEAFCRIRGYISTLRKQGLHVLSALVQLFRGAPIMPALSG